VHLGAPDSEAASLLATPRKVLFGNELNRDSESAGEWLWRRLHAEDALMIWISGFRSNCPEVTTWKDDAPW